MDALPIVIAIIAFVCIVGTLLILLTSPVVKDRQPPDSPSGEAYSWMQSTEGDDDLPFKITPPQTSEETLRMIERYRRGDYPN